MVGGEWAGGWVGWQWARGERGGWGGGAGGDWATTLYQGSTSLDLSITIAPEPELPPTPRGASPPPPNSFGIKCTLCLSWILRSDRVQALACGHTYHAECITRNLQARPTLTLETVCPYRCHQHASAAAWEQQVLNQRDTNSEFETVRARRGAAAKGKPKAKPKTAAIRRLRALPSEAQTQTPQLDEPLTVPPTLAVMFRAAESRAQSQVSVVQYPHNALVVTRSWIAYMTAFRIPPQLYLIAVMDRIHPWGSHTRRLDSRGCAWVR